MATFLVTDPDSGRKLRLTGDSPPTEAELTQIFAELPQVAQAPSMSVENKARLGTLETAASLGTGAAAIIPSGIAGVAGAIGGLVPGGETPGEKGARFVEETQEALTFQPRTETGQQMVAGLGEAIESTGLPQALAGSAKNIGQVGAVLGEPISPAVGAAIGETLPTAAGLALGIPGTVAKFTKPSALKQKIVDKIESGSTDIDTARFKVVEGALTKDPKAVEAIKQGFDEGVIPDIKQSSPDTKAKMRKMVDIMERGKKNKRFAVTNRPSDVAGDALLDRFRVVRSANRKAGKQLDSVANSLRGKQVDAGPAVTEFLDDLDSIGVGLTDDLKPRFKGSDIEGLAGPEAVISRVVNRMSKSKSPDAFELHRLKRFIDENVSFGKGGEGLTGRTESILKNLRRNLDQTLDSNFPEYDRVNTVYSETIGVIDALQDVAGRKMNLTGKNADKAAGTLMRRLMSNAQSRVPLMDSIEQIETIARKHGGKFNDDLFSQTLFVDELDSVFKPVARTSLQGQIVQGIPRSKTDFAVKAAERAAQKLRGINEEAGFRAIKDLLR